MNTKNNTFENNENDFMFVDKSTLNKSNKSSKSTVSDDLRERQSKYRKEYQQKHKIINESMSVIQKLIIKYLNNNVVEDEALLIGFHKKITGKSE
jgi:hypothetical protein